ncbi:hypothetical protein [Methyloglobulus sp.]|uniref:hypothetical protein n=1 Tax=Methyloglobulus sp. TaxID=2518622 RepID=UPI0032B849E9
MKLSGGQVCRATPSRNGLKSQDQWQTDAYEPMLLMALEADARRPKRDRRTGLMLLFEAIQKQGYTGCYSTVTDFIRRW